MKYYWLIIASLNLCIIKTTFAITANSNVNVNYVVPVTCSINNLPATINLNTLAKQPTQYSTNFATTCNSSIGIILVLNSLNQLNGSPRLLDSNGHYISYAIKINNSAINSGQELQIEPNQTINLNLIFDQAIYAGHYQDILTLNINY